MVQERAATEGHWEQGGADGGRIFELEIAAGGFVFHARVSGPETGELVLLLHGFPQTSYEWRGPMRSLGAMGYRAVAPDQRGYSPGARPAAVAEYTLPKLAADAIAIADALGAARFHVVGHDWGSAVAWVVAALVPDRVITLTGMSVPHPDAFQQQLADPDSNQSKASAYFDLLLAPGATQLVMNDDFAGLRSVYAGIPEADVEVYIRELGDVATLDAGINWYRANTSNRMLVGPPIGTIRVPTLFIWSDRDEHLCREGGELNRAFVNAPYRFEVVAGANHWIVDMAPDQISKLLLEQLNVRELTR